MNCESVYEWKNFPIYLSLQLQMEQMCSFMMQQMPLIYLDNHKQYLLNHITKSVRSNNSDHEWNF